VLARAIELERQHGGMLTEAQVREIARDLSIPEAAIEQALAEYGNRVPATSSATILPWWRSRTALAAVFVGLALLAYVLAAVTVRLFPTPLP